MSYLVIARKFRPATFDEVIGQEHITRTLKNAISIDRVGHAFLFSGPRGVGKTTTARILARALNCANGPTPTPCNECASCKQISAGNFLDVVEIDGASNNSVDNIRELREKVKYTPASGRYKVYIIDEVHMLSTSAFNALLKTLEEPPEHVKFIFATTEPQKLPATIISRCQRFDFKKIPLTDIIVNLADISAKEGIEIGHSSLHKIARAAEGSMRDAQSILDQIVASSDQGIADTDVDRILGLVDRVLIESMAEAVLCRDGQQVLQLIERLSNNGCNPVYFAQQLLGHFRNLLLLKLCKKPEGLLEVTDEELSVLKAQAKKTSTPELIQLVKIMLEDEELLRRALNSRVVLEVILLKLSEVKPLLPIEDILARLSNLEANPAVKQVRQAPAITEPLKPSAAKPPPVDKTPPAPKELPANTIPPAQEIEVNDPAKVWQRILAGVSSKKASLGAILQHGTMTKLSDQELSIAFDKKFFKDQAADADNRKVIENIIAEALGSQVKLKFAQKLLAKGSVAPVSKAEAGKKRHAPQIKEPLVEQALSLFNGQVLAVNDIRQKPADFIDEELSEFEPA